ncbi:MULTISPECIES: restriction endonuclease subunit S [unclassified Dolichospermum]|uniref:restriction endonuclease subunit S n=1 Tax=unclassified Dolichospermum TaxID=2622029 RepID=UPI001445658F|nr:MULTISPECIES: restriction endonuclease subunit S [unclassified Dolichospermum]MTJ16709.1 hypothetical protein [Dolichospermum sp. UHCC 0299]MTJ19829.1 hypothetical protein [Dolichospermum sp. UHCC 0352]MTJ41292.1 hypothetical protein [Dolichospermum sp. UHCC 0406]
MGNKLNKNVPVLRFPEFEGDWQSQKLKNILIESNVLASEELPLYSLTIESGIVPKTERYERSFLVKNEEEAYKVVQPNDFAYNPMNLRFGALARHTESKLVKVSKYYNIFSVNPKANVIFVDYLLTKSSSIRFYDSIAMGSLVEKKRVHFSDFLNSKFLLPSIAEQEKIASLLGAIDRRLTQLRRKRKLLQTYKRGVMQKIFSQKIRFKDAIGSEFPEWERKKLGNIAIDGFSNGVFNDPNKVGKGYRLINVKDMYEGDSINVETLSRLLIDEKEFVKNQAKYGDIFFTRSSLVKEGIAHSNVLLTNDSDITYDGHLIRFRFDIEENNPQFMAFLLKSSIARKQLFARGKTGTMTTIGQEDITTVKIPIPDKQEQEKIANFLTAIDRKIETISRQIDQTEQFKKGLLQKMFV